MEDLHEQLKYILDQAFTRHDTTIYEAPVLAAATKTARFV